MALTLNAKQMRRARDNIQTKIATANLAVTTAIKMKNEREQREANIRLTALETSARLFEIDHVAA